MSKEISRICGDLHNTLDKLKGVVRKGKPIKKSGIPDLMTFLIPNPFCEIPFPVLRAHPAMACVRVCP